MAGEQQILGSNIAIPQSEEERTYSREEGAEQITQQWAGPHGPVLVQYEALKDSTDPYYEDLRLQRGTVVSRVVAVREPTNDEAAFDGVVEDRWEMDRNLLRKKLRSHEIFREVEQGPYLDQCDTAITRKEEPDWTDANLWAGATQSTVDYFYLRRAGVDSYNYTAYVLRHIYVCVSSSDFEADHDNVDEVVDLPGDVPDQFLGALPEDIEWLKIAPNARRTGRRRTEVAQEWWGGTPLWSFRIYGGTWNPTPTAYRYSENPDGPIG